MRRFRWLLIAAFVLPWFEYHVGHHVLMVVASEASGVRGTPGQALAGEDMSGPWRRTREGWQRMELVRPAIQYRRPALHPAVVGSLEILLTMTAMLALSRTGGDFSFPTKFRTKSSLRRH